MTLADLPVSVRFGFLFQHEYCEQSVRQFRCYAHTLDDPQFSIEASDAGSISGRFLAQVQMEDGPHGATAGTFRMTVPPGWQNANLESVLESAEVSVDIESAPLS